MHEQAMGRNHYQAKGKCKFDYSYNSYADLACATCLRLPSQCTSFLHNRSSVTITAANVAKTMPARNRMMSNELCWNQVRSSLKGCKCLLPPVHAACSTASEAAAEKEVSGSFPRLADVFQAFCAARCSCDTVDTQSQ